MGGTIVSCLVVTFIFGVESSVLPNHQHKNSHFING